jgi:hypothetical protein
MLLQSNASGFTCQSSWIDTRSSLQIKLAASRARLRAWIENWAELKRRDSPLSDSSVQFAELPFRAGRTGQFSGPAAISIHAEGSTGDVDAVRHHLALIPN